MSGGSEIGVMTSSRGEAAFGVVGGGLQHKSPLQSSQSESTAIQNMRLNFTPDGGSAALYKPPATSPTYHSARGASTVPAGEGSPGGGGGINMNMNMVVGATTSETMKKKRGRPRKYGPDGTMALALSPSAVQAVTVTTQAGGGVFSPPPPPPPNPTNTAAASGGGGGSASPTSTSMKKSRGRPPGSTKKQHLDSLGSTGFGFTPHVITVKAGEDVSAKIMSFSQNGPRAVCILSANGAISNVTLRQPATSGGTVTYEGRFEILSLSGSFLLSETGGQRSRTGGLSVSLSGPDGRVLGGGVAGLLTAASPVQIIVGSFVADGQKESKTTNQMEPSSVAPKLAPGTGPTGASSPPVTWNSQ